MASEEEVKLQISKLSSDELMVKLINYGASVGPITGTTRPLFEKKLLSLMGVDQQANIESKNVDSSSHGNEKRISAPASAGPCTYFGVQIPIDARTVEDQLVFMDKKEALRLVKSYPGSRFKAFTTHKEAILFSKQNPIVIPPLPKTPISKPDGKPVPESSAFRGPKPQELVRLRKAIEGGDLNTVRNMVWGNPRYLVSSGDTPTVLQEGFRYNALHVCGQKNQAEICKFVLDTLQDPKLLGLLYPDDTKETRIDRVNFITDLYLNMPDKGNNETPLHFACKFGNPDVVEVLMSHPRVDKNRKNRYNEIPADVVCARARNITQDLKDRIFELLEDHYYVPLIRSEDNSTPCQISAPWSPEQLSRAISPQTDLLASPKEAPRKVKAVAGPMSPVQAENFRKHWMTPPSPKVADRRQYAEIRRSDYEKGLERIGRVIARKMQVTWTEYWQFLDSFIDFSTPEGLGKLEDYLRVQAEKVNATNSIGKQVASLEQQLGQLNLSDSGEDSGIENSHKDKDKDIMTPPSSRKSPIKLPSLKDCQGVPKLVLYTTTPTKSASKASQDSKVESASNSQRQGLIAPVKLFLRDKLTEASNNSIVCDEGQQSNSLDNSAFDSSVNGNNTVVENLTFNRSSSEAIENIGSICQTESQVTKVSDYLQGAAKESPNTGLKLEDIKANTAYRARRNSGCSDSTTSDISTASFHTCHSNILDESDSDDDDFMDFETLDATVISNVQSPAPQFFIHGASPTKEDIDVLRALETTPVSPDEFPHVAKWKQNLLSYSEKERCSWQSPSSQRVSRSTPRRPASTLSPAQFTSPPWPVTSPNSSLSSMEDESESANVRANLMSSFMSV